MRKKEIRSSLLARYHDARQARTHLRAFRSLRLFSLCPSVSVPACVRVFLSLFIGPQRETVSAV